MPPNRGQRRRRTADRGDGAGPPQAAPDRDRARRRGSDGYRASGDAATPGARPRDEDRGDGRSGGPRDARRGRGREAAPKRPEQKLYVRESVVDRGFDDLVGDDEGSEGRRVHWTIVKRSIADQKSGRATSATYVLQRDGIDTEFPTLGTARAAANKTIVHPEKLTLSKAEHAAARKQ
jgi:hypothetical protein